MYNVVIPVHKSDWPLLKRNIPYIFKYINPKFIIIISSSELEKYLKNMDRILFLDENKVFGGLSYQRVEALLRQRNGSCKRTGWYFQQFLKMAYAYCCEDPCYLLWDADTIPLTNIPFIYKNKYILDLKDEHHRPYFETIKKLLGINKIKTESFIAEHMIIDKMIMKELIYNIEKNKDLDGEFFFEKIINAISRKDIDGSGFSEFETYGSYAVKFYREHFSFRRLSSLREGKILFGDNFDEKTLNWISKSFDIVSFEKKSKQDRDIAFICNNWLVRCFKLKWIWKLYKKIKQGVYYD